MAVRNYLVEGVSGTGKTSVCHELRRRGVVAFNGDRELAYQGDPVTGEPTDTALHTHHLWDVCRLRELVADREAPIAFFCGGSRNHAAFVDLFDGVFVLDVDRATLERRLDERPSDEFGGVPDQRAFVLHLHETEEDLPRDAVRIDATQPLADVVDSLLAVTGSGGPPR